MILTLPSSSSLGSKEVSSRLNIAFQNFVTSNLYSIMCKNKLRVYRELKEDFEYKKYLYGVSDSGLIK